MAMGPALPGGALPAGALEYARAAFEATERMRVVLAKDSLEGVDARAREVAGALRAVAGELKSHPEVPLLAAYPEQPRDHGEQ